MKTSLYAKFQLILLSIDCENAMWLKKQDVYTVCLNKKGNNEPVAVFQFCMCMIKIFRGEKDGGWGGGVAVKGA